MTKEEIAGVLEQIATLLGVEGRKSVQNPGVYKCSARDRNVWREAQLSLLRSKDFSDPYFWSAFTLTGQWR